MRKLVIQVVKSKKLFWHIKLVAPNNKVLLSSETYYSRGNAERAARKLSEATGFEVVYGKNKAG